MLKRQTRVFKFCTVGSLKNAVIVLLYKQKRGHSLAHCAETKLNQTKQGRGNQGREKGKGKQGRNWDGRKNREEKESKEGREGRKEMEMERGELKI